MLMINPYAAGGLFWQYKKVQKAEEWLKRSHMGIYHGYRVLSES